MAKVKRFRDQRKSNQLSVYGRSVNQSKPVAQPVASGNFHGVHVPAEGVGQDVATTGHIRDNVSDPSPVPVRAPPRQPSQSRYPITVPGVEELMARVQKRAENPPSRISALTASLMQQPHQTYRPLFRPYLHSTTGLPVIGVTASGNTPVCLLRSIPPNPPPRPTAIELAGYSGLEELPVLQAMMNHPKMNELHTFYFQFNDRRCPASVLYVDPLPGTGKYVEIDRNCRNDGHEAWLYVRMRGDIKWRRDFMAERGGNRHVVYLTQCEEGWMWEQQLGDILDCRKSLNLWIQVKV